jgi:hypothetical protein
VGATISHVSELSCCGKCICITMQKKSCNSMIVETAHTIANTFEELLREGILAPFIDCCQLYSGAGGQ